MTFFVLTLIHFSILVAQTLNNIYINNCQNKIKKVTFRKEARILLRCSVGKLLANSWACCSAEKVTENSNCSCLADSKDISNSATSAGKPSLGMFSGKIFLILVKEYLVFPSKSDSIDSSSLNCETTQTVKVIVHVLSGGHWGGGGVLPCTCISHIGMCSPNGYGFWDVFFWNSV